MSSQRIELVAPPGTAFQPVVRLIIGGIAEQVDFGFEDIDDLQLAVERLLAEAGMRESVRITFEVDDGRVRTHLGPLSERTLADALQDEGAPGELTLPRILTTVVDSYGVDEAADGRIVVRLEKLRAP